MSGEQLAIRIRQDVRFSRLPILALSGRPVAPEVASLFAYVFMKPPDQIGLPAKINAALASVAATEIDLPLKPMAGLALPKEAKPSVKAVSDPGSTLETPALSGDQYRLLVEHAPTMVWRAGLDTKCDWFNETWLAFTGNTLDQEIGEGWVEGVHADDVKGYVDCYLVHFARREAFRMEYRLRRYDGAFRWISDRGVPFFDEQGEFTGFIGSCVDIHERRQADQAKSEFLALMIHELRTPLTPMRGYLQQLQKQADRKEITNADTVRRLNKQVEQVVMLANHLGDVACIEAGSPLAIQREEVDLVEVIQQAVSEQEELIARLGVAGPPVVFDAVYESSSLFLSADPQRLRPAMRNLLKNAVKFSPRGGTIRIEVDLCVFGSPAITIADEGIGIPESDLDQVGTKYFRASNVPAVNCAGVGLGLAITKDIVAAHCAQLTITSNHRGTTVKVGFPKAEVTD